MSEMTSFMSSNLSKSWKYIRGIRTLDFSRKTTNAVLSDPQIVDAVK